LGVKVLIQDVESQLYLAHHSQWTDDPGEARDFGFSVNAHLSAAGSRLGNFQIIFYFPDLNCKIVIYRSEPRLQMAR
jgi:hypothetical protein